MERRLSLLSATLLLTAFGCDGSVGDSSGHTTTGATGAGGSCSTEPATPTNDPLSATRLLRKVSLVLTEQPPSDADVQAVIDAPDDAAKDALIDQAVDKALASPTFYDVMQDFGREWMAMPAIPNVADAPDYMGSQQNNIQPCPQGTTNAGALSFYNPYSADSAPCNGKEDDGTTAPLKQIEPWWAPGTTVAVIGHAADEASSVSANGKTYDCGAKHGDAIAPCGCGPHLTFCHPSPSVGYANWPIFVIGNPDGQRRMLWEEPARLVAHVAWYDRPLSDLVLGSYSVGPVELQAAYVRAGRRIGATQLDQDDSWWQPSGFTKPVDPGHDGSDPKAWREFDVPSRNPYLLADRNYTFDPRVEPRGSMKGIPAAGVLTMIGMLGAQPRERVRAARMLETFACEAFIPPPSDQTFNAYNGDPAASGPCQTCHTRIDPAAIHFKRWAKFGSDIDLDGGSYGLLGVGLFTPDDGPQGWPSSVYPYGGDPYLHWVQWWRPETKMTPISQADGDANPEARFIDYLPPDQTLLGETSDGTVGPLGFAKMIVASGAFDRCAVMRLHEHFGGRKIDPGQESGYLDTLVKSFVAGGRKVRPFLKELTHSESFRRGL